MYRAILDIKKEIPSIFIKANYATTNNFTGTVVPGYLDEIAMLASPAIEELKKVQQALLMKGYSLIIFDAIDQKKLFNIFVNTGEIKKMIPS